MCRNIRTLFNFELITRAEPRDRETEAEKARARAKARFTPVTE